MEHSDKILFTTRVLYSRSQITSYFIFRLRKLSVDAQVSRELCNLKLQMIYKRFVFEINCETDATTWVVLDDRACLAHCSFISGSSFATSGKVFATMETVFDGNNIDNDNMVSERHTSRRVSTILSIWSSATIQDWEAETRAKLFER